MKNSKYSFFLNGQLISNPTDWQEIQVLSTFDNDSVQNNVSTTEVIFALDSARLIKRWVANGLDNGVGIFEGVPFTIQVSNDGNDITVGEYMLDFSTYKELEDGKVSVSFAFVDGLNTISDRLEAITFGWLESINLITKKDFITTLAVVDKPDKATELLGFAITTTIMAIALADAIRNVGEAIATISGLASSSITGGIGATVFAIAQLAVASVYLLAVLFAITNLIKQILSFFMPIPQQIYGMTYRKMMEKVCEYLGYTFETNINLENYVYLPSNRNVANQTGILELKQNQSGIPFTSDYGYTLSEFMDLIKKLFNAKFAVIGNTLHFRNKNDVFWRQQSTYKIPENTFINEKSFNNSELKANTLLSFLPDVTDEYTITNYKGTNYQIITRPKQINDERYVLLKGLNNINFNVALGNRKESLSILSQLSVALFNAYVEFTKVFGGSNSLKKVNEVVGYLKISQPYYNTPKLIYTTNTNQVEIPANYREIVSAKAIYENFYKNESFVNGNGQKLLFNNVKIPFGFDDWLKLSENSYCLDSNDKPAKITEIRWSVQSDYAEIDYWVEEQYTNNLIETYIEP